MRRERYLGDLIPLLFFKLELGGRTVISDKAMDARARRAAKCVGLIARKSRWRRDSIDNFGDCMLIDLYGNYSVAGFRFDMTAEDVIALLQGQSVVAAKERRPEHHHRVGVFHAKPPYQSGCGAWWSQWILLASRRPWPRHAWLGSPAPPRIISRASSRGSGIPCA